MQWFTRMSQRARVLTVGAVLSVAGIVIGSTVPVPYVAEGPGVTYDTLGVVDGAEMISFTGDDIPASVNQTFPDQGHLNMTTVSVTDKIPLFAALGLWAKGDHALVPREDVFPPGKTREEVRQRNKQMFVDSQTDAEIAALEYLDYPEVTYVGNIVADSPAVGKLHTQDRITAIDGTPITDAQSVIAAMGHTDPGQVVAIDVDRDGKSLTVKVTLGKHPQDPERGFIGIEPQQRPQAPFDTHIQLEHIGGPSAGLMFTLGIIDKLTDGDLSSGHFVAGTGEIKLTNDGSSPQVGAIGGVLLKMITAKRVGATEFLVPAPNCAEAVTRVPDGLNLIKVATLDDAMAALDDLAHGRTPPGC